MRRLRIKKHRGPGSSEQFKKLSDDDVNQIRKHYERGENQSKLAKEFKVNQGHISKIVNFKRRV